MSENRRDEHSLDRPEPPSTTTKQPYARPQLVDYGTLRELTQGGGGTQSDGVSGKRFVKG